MTTPNPNRLIRANGDLNSPDWVEFEVKENNKTYLDAKQEYQVAIINMDEPSLALKSGKPNPIWITWYKARKQVPRSVAVGMCKKLISGELKDFDRKPIIR